MTSNLRTNIQKQISLWHCRGEFDHSAHKPKKADKPEHRDTKMTFTSATNQTVMRLLTQKCRSKGPKQKQQLKMQSVHF